MRRCRIGVYAHFGRVLIYLIMVAQFQSLLSPFIVMFTIPLALMEALLPWHNRQ